MLQLEDTGTVISRALLSLRLLHVLDVRKRLIPHVRIRTPLKTPILALSSWASHLQQRAPSVLKLLIPRFEHFTTIERLRIC
jgi:hypothetical protein